MAAGIALAGCTSQQPPATHSAAGYVDAPFTHPLRFGALRIEPAAIGQRPLVSAARARYVALHPRTWLGGAQRDDLVAFGYGQVSAPADTVAGQSGFSNSRFAWVAVYRSSASHLLIDGCLAGPDHRTGWHLVASAPKPNPFYLAVLVDAITGAQATSIPIFRNVCAHLVRNPAPQIITATRPPDLLTGG